MKQRTLSDLPGVVITCWLLTLSLISAAAAGAQASKVLPTSAARKDANLHCHWPFIFDAGRFQQVVEGSAITSRLAVLKGFAFRRDATGGVFAARKLASLKLSVGYSSATPASMSTTFAANRSGAQTVVFSGSYNLPKQPTVTGLAPWNIKFTFSQPFPYVRSKGNLLIEIEQPGLANNRYVYVLDAHRGGKGGSTRSFGTGGSFAGRDAYSVVGSNAYLLHPGGVATLAAFGLGKPYPAVALIGFSKTRFGSLVLPFDLARLGAPGNHLYVSADLVLPLALKKDKNTWVGSVSLPLPNVSIQPGTRLFGQGIFRDAPSNNLSLVFSNGVELFLDPQPGAPFQSLGSVDSSSATGVYGLRASVGFDVIGGPVIQLTGSGFN